MTSFMSAQIRFLSEKFPHQVLISQKLQFVLRPSSTNQSLIYFYQFLILTMTFRLRLYGLDDVEDSVANYLILSLQSEQIKPKLEVIH